MEQSWILIDEATGLHVRWYFWLRVLDEVNRSARYGAPFALLLLEARPEAGVGHRSIEQAASRVPAAIRGTDIGGALGEGKVGVLLMQQDEQGAETATARVIERLVPGQPHGVSWVSRLLCYPRDGGEISSLLTVGWAERPSRHLA